MASIAILHYTAPFVMGGVEAVIEAHAKLFTKMGHAPTIIAGRGGPGDEGRSYRHLGEFVLIPEMDSQHPEIQRLTRSLWHGVIQDGYEEMQRYLFETLDPILQSFDNVIIHNILTKEFNLPLTAALFQMLDRGVHNKWINWCHDAAWASRRESTRDRVRYPGTPWSLLRSFDLRLTYVTGSEQRREELTSSMIPPDHMTSTELLERINVIYNGVDEVTLLGLSEEGRELIDWMSLFEFDLIMLMPVRISQAKNIEFAVEVVQKIKEKRKNPCLVVTGPPDAHSASDLERYRSLKNLIDESGLGNNVFFAYDWVAKNSGIGDRSQGLPYSLVAELYRVSDLVIMPSRREGFGIPVFEAALVGMPFFCSANVPAVNALSLDIPTFMVDQHEKTVIVEETTTKVAEKIHQKMFNDNYHLARVKVRKRYKWSDIYRYDIEPLLAK